MIWDGSNDIMSRCFRRDAKKPTSDIWQFWIFCAKTQWSDTPRKRWATHVSFISHEHRLRFSIEWRKIILKSCGWLTVVRLERIKLSKVGKIYYRSNLILFALENIFRAIILIKLLGAMRVKNSDKKGEQKWIVFDMTFICSWWQCKRWSWSTRYIIIKLFYANKGA